MTGVRLHIWAALAVLLMGVAGLDAAFAQTPLTLEDAIKRAQGDTADARALASSIDEANARIQRAQSGFWPRVDLTETVQRGNQPVYVFSSLLSQRRFTAANFAIPALNHPDPVTNTRTAVALEQPVYNAGLTRLGVQAATLERDMATATRDTARQDLGFRAAQAFVRVLQLEATVRATDAAVAAAESDRQRARARRDVGLVTEADVLAVDVQLADMRQRQIAAAGDLAVGRIQLAEAVGLPLTASVAPVRPASRPAPADGDALVREALTRHPQLLQANIQLQLAENGAAHRSCRAVAHGRRAGWLGVQRRDARRPAIELGVWRGGAREPLPRVCGHGAHDRSAATRTSARPPSANAWSDESKWTCAGRSRNSPPRAPEKRPDAPP